MDRHPRSLQKGDRTKMTDIPIEPDREEDEKELENWEGEGGKCI